MRIFLLTTIAILAGLMGPSFAQTPDEIESAVEAAIPEGWSLSRFTLLDEPPAGAADTGGKIVGAAIDGAGASATKLPEDTPAGEAVYFGGALVATDMIYEPLYAIDGMAIVRPLFEEGFEIPVTGTFNGEVSFDQGGLSQLGRPLGSFDIPALIEGSDEAEEFLEGRGAATAEGTMGKLMNEDGEPL